MVALLQQNETKQKQVTPAAFHILATTLKEIFSDAEAIEVYRCFGECNEVVVIIVSEQICQAFVEETQKHLRRSELNHLFPAQVRFTALGELCAGNKELQLKFFRKPKSLQLFADVLFLPSNWRERAYEFSIAYYSTTPEHVCKLVGKTPLTKV